MHQNDVLNSTLQSLTYHTTTVTNNISITTTASPPAAPTSIASSKSCLVTGGAGDVDESTRRAVDDPIGDSIAIKFKTEEVDTVVGLTSDVDIV